MRYPEIVPLALLFAGFKIKSQHTKPENGNACFFLFKFPASPRNGDVRFFLLIAV